MRCTLYYEILFFVYSLCYYVHLIFHKSTAAGLSSCTRRLLHDSHTCCHFLYSEVWLLFLTIIYSSSPNQIERNIFKLSTYTAMLLLLSFVAWKHTDRHRKFTNVYPTKKKRLFHIENYNGHGASSGLARAPSWRAPRHERGAHCTNPEHCRVSADR